MVFAHITSILYTLWMKSFLFLTQLVSLAPAIPQIPSLASQEDV